MARRHARPFDYVAVAAGAMSFMVLATILLAAPYRRDVTKIHWLNVQTGRLQISEPGAMGTPQSDAVAALGPVSNVCTAAQLHTHDSRLYYCVKVGANGWAFNGPPPYTPCNFDTTPKSMNGYGCTRENTGIAWWTGHWRPLR